jgi:membrane protease YdiL (CAAX protease family)
MREAVSLALILGLTLSMSALERRGRVPWEGYPSSLLLLLLSLWYWKHFRVDVRFFHSPSRAWVFPISFCSGLVFVVLFSAGAPFSPHAGQTPSILQLIHLIVVVPLTEELYFRGLLLEHLRRGFSTVSAVVLCTVLFGLLHVPVGAGLVAGALSSIACLLVVKGGSLVYAFQLHITWNAMTQVYRMGDNRSRWIWASAAAAVIAVLAVVSFVRQSKHDSAE